MPTDDRYEWVFRKSHALTLLLNEEGMIVDASDAWLRRFGYSLAELTNVRPKDLASDDAAKKITEEYLPVLRRTGRLDSVAVDLRTKQGELSDVLASSVTERGAEGKPLRTVVNYVEIGQQARIEQRYRELYRTTPAMLHTVNASG